VKRANRNVNRGRTLERAAMCVRRGSVEMKLTNELRRIVESMLASNRNPLKIYLTYAQFEALRIELAMGRRGTGGMTTITFMGLPVEVTEAGTGMWVTCETIGEVTE
jgi:hypothetical protein